LAPEEPDDRALLDRFVAGDEEAFTLLMRRHEDRIFAVALRITGNRDDALEATQETFVSLFRRAGSYKGEAEPGTWLYRIGMNAARDVLRRRARLPAGDEGLARAEGRAASGQAVDEAAGLRVDLARALESLPIEYRDAVVMHDLGGIPYEEIARLGGVALGTVKSRISRGRRLLAGRLEPRPNANTSKDAR
jgi:RNA polymerase sigma-70 factor (ECF subfamily)